MRRLLFARLLLTRLLFARLLLTGLLCLAISVAALAQDAAADSRAALIQGLEDLAHWCGKNQLYAKRNGVADEILKVDPAHGQAHRWLRHRKDKDGVWHPPVKPPPASDRSDEALVAYPARRSAYLRSYVHMRVAELDALGDGVAPGIRERILSEILELSPRDEDLRLRHHDVKDGTGWVLLETARSRKVRAKLTEAVQKSFAAIGIPAESAAREDEIALEVPWRAGVRTEHVRVVASSGPEEATQAARCAEAAPALLSAAIGAKRKHWQGFTIYIMTSHEQRGAFLKNHPDMTNRHRRAARQFRGYWMPDQSDWLTWDSSRARRVDACTRQTVNKLLLMEFRLDSGKTAWAGEGFGLRLTYELCGTRKNYLVGNSRYGNQDEGGDLRSLATDADWYRAALEVLESGDPEVRDVLHRPLSQMSGGDALVAHALAAYFLEGWPDECPEIIRRVATGEHDEQVIQSVTGLDTEALDLRLRRWLRERMAE